MPRECAAFDKLIAGSWVHFVKCGLRYIIVVVKLTSYCEIYISLQNWSVLPPLLCYISSGTDTCCGETNVCTVYITCEI